MRRLVLTLAASILTAVYWWAVFAYVYAGQLFAGDRDPAAVPPPDRDVLIRAGVTIVVAVLLYAALAEGWRRVARPRRSPPPQSSSSS